MRCALFRKPSTKYRTELSPTVFAVRMALRSGRSFSESTFSHSKKWLYPALKAPSRVSRPLLSTHTWLKANRLGMSFLYSVRFFRYASSTLTMLFFSSIKIMGRPLTKTSTSGRCQ